MLISLVVAAADDHAIGRENDLLWKLPNDMKFFKNLTWGMPVIMGRKTFVSMRSKPLPGRINIVITRDPSSYVPGDHLWFCESLEEAMIKAKSTDCLEAFVIGGGEIYRQSLSMANKIYMTRVHASFPDAEVHFPEIEKERFHLVTSLGMPADEKHPYPYTFETWEATAG